MCGKEITRIFGLQVFDESGFSALQFRHGKVVSKICVFAIDLIFQIEPYSQQSSSKSLQLVKARASVYKLVDSILAMLLFLGHKNIMLADRLEVRRWLVSFEEKRFFRERSGSFFG